VTVTLHCTSYHAAGFLRSTGRSKNIFRWSEMPRGTVCVCPHVSVQVLFSLPFPRASWLFSSWKDLGRLTQLCFQNLFRHLVGLLWTSDQHSQRHLPAQHNTTQKYENVCTFSEIRTHDLTF
jgi:hypothetical protein